MRILETTQFWNEANFFKERVQNTLRYAHCLVISESQDAFSRKISRPFVVPKLLADLPAHLRDRVIFVPVDLKPLDDKDHWTREAFVRQSGFEHLRHCGILRPSDIVLVQDFDELFDPRCKNELLAYFRWPWRQYIHPRYRCTYYYLNHVITEPFDHLYWTYQVAFRASYGLSQENFSIHQLRIGKSSNISKHYWGWHHSYLGGSHLIADKIRAFSHADDSLITAVTPEEFKQRITNHEDLFGRAMKFAVISNYADIGIPDLVPRGDLQLPL